MQKNIGCNFLVRKIERWVNDNSGNVEKDFTFRFRGKESLLYMKHFPALIGMLLNENNDRNIRLKV